MTFSYIIWNVTEIFSLGSFCTAVVRFIVRTWVLLSQQILYYIFKKEGKPQADVDTLTIYMVLATVIGARWPCDLLQPGDVHNKSIGIIMPFEFEPTSGLSACRELASHGGAFGILFALWLYSRKKKPGQNYLSNS